MLLLSRLQHVEEVIELLDSCEISREDLTESMESFKMPGIKRHAYTELDTKAKTAFTRIYNKASHKSQGVVERELAATTVKKGRGRAAAVADEADGGLPPASDAESEAEADGDDVDISKFQKKPRGRAAASASSDAAKGKRKAPAAASKAAPKKRKA
jgi:replication factor C subunit 1